MPSFLLHVAPQVTISGQTATAWLDGKAGIQRTQRERIEQSLRDIIRKMRKVDDAEGPHSAEALRLVKVFMRIAERLERTSEDEVFGTAGFLVVAETWSKEPGLTQSQFLERLDNLVRRQNDTAKNR